jgi:1-acyl-sn-glycerol-3-phosphate acyltransferase
MTRGLRAAWRLLRAVVHALHGLAIAVAGFESLPVERREALIRWWATKMLRVMGIELQVEGAASAGGTLLVANHISWLDIMAVHAVVPQARFVSKADVKHWPLLSRLVTAGGTLYLERERKRDALRVVHLMAEALSTGQTVAIFPEGTTSDGRTLLPFHANLLQAAIGAGSPVQPIALRYSDAVQAKSDAVEFVGATTLMRSLWQVANGERVVVHVTLVAPRDSANVDRRQLAQALRDDIAAQLAG